MFLHNPEKCDVKFIEHGTLIDLPNGSTKEFPPHIIDLLKKKYPWLQEVAVYEAEVSEVPKLVESPVEAQIEAPEATPEVVAEEVKEGKPCCGSKGIRHLKSCKGK
jgi:hypothetical protein